MADIKLFNPFIDGLFFEITNRYGGVSSAPYDSFNFALHVGDNPLKVLENRMILAEKSDFLVENLLYMDQTHSDNIAVITDCAVNKIEDCDAMITHQKNIPLMVMVADCIPILLYDPVKKVIGVAHAGRNGTFKEIAKKTVLKMKETFDVKVSDLLVYLGPSIHACCYEVGSEIAEIVIKNFGEKYIKIVEQRWFLDLQHMNLDQLMDIGVQKEHIETSLICTCCDKDYFSYRREGVTGRFSGIIKLR